MKFLTLTRIAALLATSGLASASIDVCALGVKLECDRTAKELLGILDSMPPPIAFRSVRKLLESGCDGACLSSELKADLCEKAHSSIKPLIREKIYLEDIEQCFAVDMASTKEESCHVSNECPPGTPEGNICITESCVSPNAAAQAGPRAMSTEGDNCLITYECPPGTPEGKICLTEICDSEKPASQCLKGGEYLGPFSTPDSVCKEKCCSGSCHVGYSCPPGTPKDYICISTDCGWN